MKFIGREKELKILQEEYRKNGARLVVLYGRRRIGKTRLIEEFIHGKNNHVYYLAADEKDFLQINEFKQLVGNFLRDEFLVSNRFEDWKSFFAYLEKVWPRDKNIILIIDEVTYIIKNNESFPSYFQQFWDRFLSKTNTKVILSGSIVNLMLKKVLGGESPLYGRRTAEIFLRELDISEIMGLLSVSLNESILFYSVLGGVPKYLELVDRPFSDFVFSMLDKNSFFYREGVYLMREELRDISTYSNILTAISEGKTKLKEISSFVNIDARSISAYLDILENLGFIKKEIPVIEEEKEFRGAFYTINDNFLNFWFLFIHKNRSLIELDNKEEIRSILNQQINSFIGTKFEIACRKIFYNLNVFSCTKIGRQWGKIPYADKDKNQYEIDICALNEKTKEILFGECKWQDKVNALVVVNELKDKASYVDWNKEKRKEIYALFAKSFSKKITEFEGIKVYCFDLKDIGKLMKK